MNFESNNYESPIYATNCPSMIPFKIVVEDTLTSGMHSVVVKRINYIIIEGKRYEDVHILCGSTWKENSCYERSDKGYS